MRVVSLPSTLNAESGLICLQIGKRKDLEAVSALQVIEKAKPTRYIWPALTIQGYPEPAWAVKNAQR